jgi:NAD+ synthase
VYRFDREKTKDRIIAWVRDFFDKNGKDSPAVVAISGGKDSSVTAAICKEALGKERVFGILLPKGIQEDIDMSFLLVETLEIEYAVVNIEKAFQALTDEMATKLGCELSSQTLTNLPARIRMAATYAASQSMNGRVANTSNLSEDWVGYATRYGDSVGDFSPLSRLTAGEVKEIGLALHLPEELIYKTPIDGLSGKTDEENLGFTYEALDRYIRTGVCEDESVKALIDKKHRANAFKMEPMPVFDFDGPICAAE